MSVRLPDVNALGRRPVPQGNRPMAQQDTTAPGRALAGLGEVVGQIGEEWQKREDEQKVLEYRRKLIEWDKVNVHDPETGAAGKTGKDAFDLPKTLAEGFDKFAADAAKDLSTNRQRKIAQEMAMGRREQITNWASGHALKEREKFAAQEYEANIGAFKDNALLYPTLAPAELENMAAATKSYYGSRLGPEALAAKIKADASEVHSRIVLSMVKGGRAAEAESYFKANAPAMAAKDKMQAQDALNVLTTRAKVQAFEDEVIASGASPEDALAKARAKFADDPLARDAAVSQIKTLVAEREALESQAKKRTVTSAWGVVMERGTMSAIEPDLMAALRSKAPEEERQMRDWLRARADRAKSDAEGKKSEDWGAYMALRDMAHTDPDRFSDPQTLLKAQPYLSNQQMTTLVNVRDSLAKNDLKAMESERTVQRTIKLVKADLLSAGIDLTPKEGTSKAKETAQFFGALTMALDQATADKGKPLTDEEARRIGTSMVRDGYVQESGLFFDDKKKRFLLKPEEASKFVTVRYGDIPPAIRKQLEAELPKTIYGNVDKGEVERMYQRAVDAGRIK